MPHALIVDDDADVRGFMSEVARREGFTVASAESLGSARAQLARQRPDVLLTDLRLPDGNGIDLVSDLDGTTDTEVVIVTGHASVDSAVEALRVGATDYLIKPVDVDRLSSILRRQPRPADLKLEIGELRHELRRAGRFGHLWGASPPMQQLFDRIARVAPTSASVLLIGEGGTGRELAARTIHDLSRRRRGPFLAINCGLISPQLIESELFGHEESGFTGADGQHKGLFERASGGTILLDEVTELPLALQVKLLCVLETGTFVRVGTTRSIPADVRIVAATSQQPGKAVQGGKFREDLYHRLNVFRIHLPPLRERGTDLEMLAEHFLQELNATEGTRKRFSPEAISRLHDYAWPGNVRELKNYVQRAYIMADDVIHDGGPPDDTFGQDAGDDLLTVRVGTPLEEIERLVTMATLARCNNVKRRTAEILGISLKTLYNRLEAYAAKDKAGAGQRRAEEVH